MSAEIVRLISKKLQAKYLPRACVTLSFKMFSIFIERSFLDQIQFSHSLNRHAGKERRNREVFFVLKKEYRAER
jgi:hypothetical protein